MSFLDWPQLYVQETSLVSHLLVTVTFQALVCIDSPEQPRKDCSSSFNWCLQFNIIALSESRQRLIEANRIIPNRLTDFYFNKQTDIPKSDLLSHMQKT